MRACVFVDGENFRHSIVGLFPQFSQAEYLPRSANWGNLFDWIVEKVTDNGERIRTYWYVIKSVDFWPYSFPNPTRESESLRRLLSKHEPYKQELDALDDATRASRMGVIVQELNQHKDSFTRRFNGWLAIQEGIATRHRAIEFRRAGAITHNLFTKALGSEKAVDVKLASDMITLKEIYDIAIIVSGDQDYVPAVEVVKDYGRRVVNVAFETRGGKLLPGGARRLNQVTDWSLNIRHQDLDHHLNI